MDVSHTVQLTCWIFRILCSPVPVDAGDTEELRGTTGRHEKDYGGREKDAGNTGTGGKLRDFRNKFKFPQPPHAVPRNLSSPPHQLERENKVAVD